MGTTPSHATKVLISTGAGLALQFVAIAQGSPGTTQLVAGITGKKINVISYIVVMSAAGTAKFIDDVGDLTGAMPLVANGGVAAPGISFSPWFETSTGSALSIVTTGGAAAGHLTFALE